VSGATHLQFVLPAGQAFAVFVASAQRFGTWVTGSAQQACVPEHAAPRSEHAVAETHAPAVVLHVRFWPVQQV
jgi:hypothetical protein